MFSVPTSNSLHSFEERTFPFFEPGAWLVSAIALGSGNPFSFPPPRVFPSQEIPDNAPGHHLFSPPAGSTRHVLMMAGPPEVLAYSRPFPFFFAYPHPRPSIASCALPSSTVAFFSRPSGFLFPVDSKFLFLPFRSSRRPCSSPSPCLPIATPFVFARVQTVRSCRRRALMLPDIHTLSFWLGTPLLIDWTFQTTSPTPPSFTHRFQSCFSSRSLDRSPSHSLRSLFHRLTVPSPCRRRSVLYFLHPLLFFSTLSSECLQEL